MTQYEVIPIEVGSRKADASVFLHMTEPGTTFEVIYRLWVLKSDSQLVVVDTGPPLDESHQRGITKVQDLDDAMKPYGFDAKDISLVYLTHLHWDHAANADKFPNATFFAQQREIDFFKSPMRAHKTFDRYYSHQEYLAGLIDEGRIKSLDGDMTLDHGIDVMRVGGHTPGSQMVVVDTTDGKAVLTGDAIPSNRNFIEDIPSGIVIDVQEAVNALARVREMNPAVLFTGHDPNERLVL
jgi:glyoxylase-like metal-dependent hydrolase (beta-lactamase superfamily II)